MDGDFDFGERWQAENRGWGYFAHLSIYDFAAKLCAGQRVLDVGCGTGYGIPHLFAAGVAALAAIERDASLVAKLQAQHPSASIRKCDLEDDAIPFPDHTFDVAFSSNVLEHVIGVNVVLSEIVRVLTPAGKAIIAVPPIDSLGEVIENAKNIYHINNLSTTVWMSKLGRYFETVEQFRHWMVPHKCKGEHAIDSQSETNLGEFTFNPRAIGDPTITAIFLCSKPRASALDAKDEVGMPPEWRSAVAEARARIAVIENIMIEHKNLDRYWRGEIASIRAFIESNSTTPANEVVDALRNRFDHYYR